MILNFNENSKYDLYHTDWDSIIERYFDGETSDEEEKMLKRFLATPQASDKKYDEIKAVMGYVAVGKTIYDRSDERGARKSISVHPYRWVAAVVIGCIIGTAGWKIVDSQQNVCVAYIGGEKCTDTQKVMAQVRQSLHAIDYEECKGTVDDQLSDMFATISDNENQEMNEQ